MAVAEVLPTLRFEEGGSGLLVPEIDSAGYLGVVDAHAFLHSFAVLNHFLPSGPEADEERVTYWEVPPQRDLWAVTGSIGPADTVSIDTEPMACERWNHPSVAMLGKVLGFEYHTVYGPGGFDIHGRLLTVSLHPVVHWSKPVGEITERITFHGKNGWATDRSYPADQREAVEDPLLDLRARLLR